MTGTGRDAAAAALAAVLLAASCGEEPAAARPRNVLLVVLDTTRADRLSTYGHGVETSPVVTALAERGTRFDAAHAQSSLTPVSAGSFLTGVYPPRHGVRSLFVVAEETLAPEVTTLAERLSDAGLATAGFVSAVPMSARYGLDRGFGEYSDTFGHKPEAPCGNAYQRRADETTDLALEWLATNGLDRFFLMVHWFDAHDANTVPPREFLEPRVSFPLPPSLDRPCALMGLGEEHKRELYDAEVAFMDAQLGRLLERLERLRVLEDTLVVVLADHGEGLGDHGVWTHGWLYGEQLRVPLVLAGPGVPAGRVVADRVRLVDLVPTVLELCDLGRVGDWNGASLVPLLRGATESPRELYAEVHHSVEDRLGREPEMYTVTSGGWKYVHRPASGRHELYDLAADPREGRSVYRPDHPQVALLRGRLEALNAVDGGRVSVEDVEPELRDPVTGLGY